MSDGLGKAERLAEVRAAVAEACRAAGREAGSVRLMGVSKTKPWEDVREFAALGLRDFGENYVQEALPKVAAAREAGLTGGADGLHWHFIGSLQSNKAKLVAGEFSLFHALDSLSLANKLGTAALAKGTEQACLVEVNVDSEENKGGVRADGLPDFLRELNSVAGIRVEGLMCIPAPPLPGRSAREPFARLRGLLETVNGSGLYRLPLRELSMGMSSDFKEAILEGSTYVRVGTALFGERQRRSAG